VLVSSAFGGSVGVITAVPEFFCSALMRSAMRCACCCWLKLKARRAPPALDNIVLSAIWPAPGFSISASSAPRGSDAMTAIEPGRGPSPNRCSASAATPFASSDMVVFPVLRQSLKSKRVTVANAGRKVPQVPDRRQHPTKQYLSINRAFSAAGRAGRAC